MPSRFFRVPLAEIGYVRMIVEGYDGLAAVRSRQAGSGEIEWLIGEGLLEEAETLALRLQAETPTLPTAASRIVSQLFLPEESDSYC